MFSRSAILAILQVQDRQCSSYCTFQLHRYFCFHFISFCTFVLSFLSFSFQCSHFVLILKRGITSACLLCDSELSELLEVRRKLLKPPTAAPPRSAPPRSATPRTATSASNSTQNFSGGDTEESNVYMTRSLNGAVSSHGLSSSGPCSLVGSTAANPAPDCKYCRSFVKVLKL